MQISYSYYGVDLDVGAILIESASHVMLSQVTITHSLGSAMVVNDALFDSTVIKYSCTTGLSKSDSTISFTGNNTFMNNSGSALTAFASYLYFNGQTIFEYNAAYLGGGIYDPLQFHSRVEWLDGICEQHRHRMGGAIFMQYDHFGSGTVQQKYSQI